MQFLKAKTEEMLNEFNPLFVLRYSATHKEDFKYNGKAISYNQQTYIFSVQLNVNLLEISENGVVKFYYCSDSCFVYRKRKYRLYFIC